MAQPLKRNKPANIKIGAYRLRFIRGRKDGRWYWQLLDYRGHSNGATVGTGWGTAKEAEVDAWRLCLGGDEAEDDDEDGTPKDARTVGDVVQLYLDWRLKQQVSVDMPKNYRSQAKKLRAHFDAVRVEDFTSDHITDYIEAREVGMYGRLVKCHKNCRTARRCGSKGPCKKPRRQPAGVGSIYHELVRLQAAFKHGVRHGYTHGDFPEFEYRYTEADRRDSHTPESDEARAVALSLPPGWLRVTGILLFATGARPAELYRLERSHIDLEKGFIRFRKTKTRKARNFPLGPGVVALVGEHLPDGQLWGDREECSLDAIRSTFRHALDRAIDNHGVQRFTPKAYRVLMTNRFLDQGDLAALTALMGHSPAVALEYYRAHKTKQTPPPVDI